MTTTEATSRALPLAAVLADLKAQLATASGQEGRNLAQDLRWARRDQGHALQADADALRMAEHLAEQGDEDAIAAVQLARELEPLSAPTSAASSNAAVRHVASTFGRATILDDLLDRMTEARRRNEGFAEAWGQALVELGALSGLWHEVLSSTKRAWQCAYEGRPTPAACAILPWGDEDCGHEF